MLSAADNEALTRVGPGSLMGDLLRQYWLPVLLSTDLAPAGPPVRVRVLAEDLVAFRDGRGAVGLLAEGCPHRGASLYFGRVDDGGLRCAYHGWKFRTDGQCVEMPSEPVECRFADKVRAVAYACRERNGVVWAYLGPRTAPPPLPELEWNLAPASPPFVWRTVRACNWVQALEGDLDSAHVAVLHATPDDPEAPTVPGGRMPGAWGAGMRRVRGSGPPHLHVVDTPYGALYSARRAVGDADYHRIHPFLFPFHTMVGGELGHGDVSFNGKAWVPMDDEHTLVFEWQYRPARPWSDVERVELERIRNPWGFLPPTGAAAGAFRSRANRDNDYLIDRTLEGGRLGCGILSNPLQDAAVQESMGPIVDRTREHLGPGDAMIVRVRRRLLEAARGWRERRESPPGVDVPAVYRVRPVGIVLPRDADWLAASRDARDAFAGAGA